MLKYIVLFAAILWSSVSYADNYLIEFTAPWCDYCHKLEANINTKQVQSLLAQRNIKFAKSDVDSEPEYARMWGVTSIPVLVLCKTENGRTIEIKRHVGYMTVNELLEFLK